MKQKKIPMRMCVGCREMKPKKELIRVVRPPEGSVMLDRTGKAAGRGAYVCPSSACLEKARKAKTLSARWRAQIATCRLRAACKGVGCACKRNARHDLPVG